MLRPVHIESRAGKVPVKVFSYICNSMIANPELVNDVKSSNLEAREKRSNLLKGRRRTRTSKNEL